MKAILGQEPRAVPGVEIRWPDARLRGSFRNLLGIFHGLIAKERQESGDPQEAVRTAYRTICKWMEDAARQSKPGRVGAGGQRRSQRLVVQALVAQLKSAYASDWLQAVASLLGMLMHFSVSDGAPQGLANHRRPGKPFSTYPTSPAVARFLADAVVGNLPRARIPERCRCSRDAAHYAERAFGFRVLDPSMESGQLLLEVAMACVREVRIKHPPRSAAARRLIQAILTKLCRDSLWGIDRNELAATAVGTVFSMLGADLGVRTAAPRHMFTGDAFRYLKQGDLSGFDAVVNNPPWGEALTPDERKELRAGFASMQHRSDTYVAFTELGLRCVRPGGIFALVVPSQAVATRNATGWREMLAGQTKINTILLLPQTSFADATVRGLVIVGRRRRATALNRIRVVTYPMGKGLCANGPARSFVVDAGVLRSIGTGSWWPLLHPDGRREFRGPTVPLGRVATVALGVQVHHRGRGVPPQTRRVVQRRPFVVSRPVHGAVPAIQGRDVREFRVSEARRFLKFGPWLAWVGQHAILRRRHRIFVRELCRRDGRMVASTVGGGSVPLHGVLTIVPTAVRTNALIGILNSSVAAEYVRTSTGSYTKVDFQKITVTELRSMPIPMAAIPASGRAMLGVGALGPHERGLRDDVENLVRRLARMPSSSGFVAIRLKSDLDAAVSAMYGMGGRARHG